MELENRYWGKGAEPGTLRLARRGAAGARPGCGRRCSMPVTWAMFTSDR